MPPEARRALLALLVVTPLFAGGCVCSHSAVDPVLQKATFGDLASASVDLAPYVALARTLVMHAERPKEIAPAPGRRVFLTLYPKRAPRVVSTGLGETLEASVVAAAAAIPPWSDAGGKARDDGAFRVQLDVVDKVEPTNVDDASTTWANLGMAGFFVVAGPRTGYVLPSELLYDKDFESSGGKSVTLETGKIWKLIEARGSGNHDDAKAFRMRTRAVVDSASGKSALELRRGTISAAHEVTATNLLESVRLGADYLCRILDEHGRYIYRYRPTDDHPSTDYGLLRHSGSTYALLEAYEELKVPLYLEKAEVALAYAEARITWVDDSGQKDGYLLDGADEEQQKVGGAGLGLIALAKHIELTGSHDHLENARALARFIVHQQYPDGHFRANKDVEREGQSGGKSLKSELLYYPGEAILGLLRLFRVDPDPAWLAAAKKGADYCVHVRDADVPMEGQEHDHWLTYALNDLYRVAEDKSYLDHADKIAKAIIFRQKTGRDAPASDFVGSFFPEAPSTPASTRLEALAADVELARYAKRPEAWLVKPATAIAKFTRAQQLDEERVFFARNPEEALGGVRESLFVEEIRIDYVQHALSGWIHLARELRDPGYLGWPGPAR